MRIAGADILLPWVDRIRIAGADSRCHISASFMVPFEGHSPNAFKHFLKMFTRKEIIKEKKLRPDKSQHRVKTR